MSSPPTENIVLAVKISIRCAMFCGLQDPATCMGPTLLMFGEPLRVIPCDAIAKTFGPAICHGFESRFSCGEDALLKIHNKHGTVVQCFHVFLMAGWMLRPREELFGKSNQIYILISLVKASFPFTSTGTVDLSNARQIEKL